MNRGVEYMDKENTHVPVLLDEVLSFFMDVKPRLFCDVTLGAGGHARHLLEHLSSIERYDGWDRDEHALEIAQKNLEDFKSRVCIRKASFSELRHLISSSSYDGVLADLGVSSMQLDNPNRGFSFRYPDSVLDMRMDQDQDWSALDVLNTYNKDELGYIFREYGEEPLWDVVSEAIVKYRKAQTIRTVEDLMKAVIHVFPRYRLNRKIHPLTLIFMALRVYVNSERSELESLLELAISWLNPGGRLAIISFCSLEDRPVKRAFLQAASQGLGKVLTKKVVMPKYTEVRSNPRARSAKLRCFEKIKA